MRISIAFNLWLACITTIYCVVESASTAHNQRLTQNCQRIINELDQNNIVKQQKACNLRPKLDDYFRDRQDILNYEVESSFAYDIKLNENEKLANVIIMQAKTNELDTGFMKPYLFNPSRHIFEVLDVIKQSKLFQIIQKMPKGGILHAHDTALCSANYIVTLTYWPDLWQRTSNISDEIEEFVFSREQPNNQNLDDVSDSVWRRVSDVRAEKGASNYDQHVRKMFTLFDKNVNPRIQFADVNDVWTHFMGIFIKLQPIVTYAPAWKAYYKHALKEMQEDNVQYLEFRGILPQVTYTFPCQILFKQAFETTVLPTLQSIVHLFALTFHFICLL